MIELVQISAIAVLTSGGAVAFFWWLIKRALETKFRESEAQAKSAIARIEAAAKALMHEDIRRTGAFYDDRYATIKALFQALERFDVRVLSMEVELYSPDRQQTEEQIAEGFKKIRGARDKCSEIVEQNGFLISDSLRTKVTECQAALSDVVNALIVAVQTKKQAGPLPPKPDRQAVDKRIYEIRAACWRELGLGLDQMS